MTRALLVAALLALAAPAGAQLPPQILLDQLVLRTERLVEADDLDAAVDAMEEALALAVERELELPANFRFVQARTEFAVGLLAAAKESVTEYLTVIGREAESYVKAVALLEDVDRILERRNATECSPLPEGSACWMELTSHPGCYVWNPAPQATETATWTGECSAGFAEGPGTVTWTYRDGEQEHEASRRFGQPHGESVMRDSEGWVDEGPFRFGKRHGDWIERTADGAVLEGPYVDGEENGPWVLRFTDNRGIQEGPYKDGEMHGRWVHRFASGTIGEGPYVDGKQHGRWIWTYSDGQIESGPYVDGKQHGRWVVRFASGAVQEGPLVDGVRNGRWVDKDSDGDVGEGPYVDGERNGHWVQRFTDGNTAEGPFVDGKRHGHWIWRFPSGQVESGPYVDDEQHGRWRIEPPNGDTFYVTFVRGVRQER